MKRSKQNTTDQKEEPQSQSPKGQRSRGIRQQLPGMRRDRLTDWEGVQTRSQTGSHPKKERQQPQPQEQQLAGQKLGRPPRKDKSSDGQRPKDPSPEVPPRPRGRSPSQGQPKEELQGEESQEKMPQGKGYTLDPETRRMNAEYRSFLAQREERRRREMANSPGTAGAASYAAPLTPPDEC
ncbi:hypothetical protein BDV28DRAFT_145416 [Aspergillus coremiiformis]|uniref:Uncharacterized protein n=1 Tax=Aspergillus coremiiformis TaxID=138285 RepID=A0A5N6ZG80_9EURO|nr:hypothetical protein BDV28DRAFT_145416 [Aspergillus coremiiformis]